MTKNDIDTTAKAGIGDLQELMSELLNLTLTYVLPISGFVSGMASGDFLGLTALLDKIFDEVDFKFISPDLILGAFYIVLGLSLFSSSGKLVRALGAYITGIGVSLGFKGIKKQKAILKIGKV